MRVTVTATGKVFNSTKFDVDVNGPVDVDVSHVSVSHYVSLLDNHYYLTTYPKNECIEFRSVATMNIYLDC